MHRDIRQIVGANVRRLRTEAGLTQAALADLLEVDRAYVSGLERGDRNPTLMTLFEVSQALGVALTDLVAGDR